MAQYVSKITRRGYECHKQIALCALCFVVFALAFSGPSYAGLAAKASAFLEEINIDPESPNVKLAADDVTSNHEGTKNVSLNSLAQDLRRERALGA